MKLFISLTPRQTHKINPLIHSTFFEYFGSVIYDGIWVGKDSSIPNVEGIRKDVITGMKEAGIKGARWPGGCCADHYHWKDGIGEKRYNRLHPMPGKVKVWRHEFGTDEFFTFCRLTGAEPILVANTATGSPSEFLDWYEYVNGPEDTLYGSMRASAGHPEPYNVKYWGLGNTDENVWWIDYDNPVAYAQDYLRFLTVIRDLTKDLHIIGLGLSQRHNTPGWVGKYLDHVTRQKRAKGPDSLSIHHYIGSAKGNYKNCGGAVDFTDDQYYNSLDAISTYQKDIDLHRGYISDHTNPKYKTTICFDEWGMWHDEASWENETRQRQTLRDAIFAACSLHVFYKNSDIVELAMETQLTNLLQSLFETRGEECVRTPTYYVFKMFKNHLEGNLLTVNQNTENPMLDYVFSMNGEGDTITATLVNKDLYKPCTISLDLDEKWEISQSHIIHTENVRTQNSFSEPFNIVDGEFPQKNMDNITLPEHSITRFVIKRTQ